MDHHTIHGPQNLYEPKRPVLFPNGVHWSIVRGDSLLQHPSLQKIVNIGLMPSTPFGGEGILLFMVYWTSSGSNGGLIGGLEHMCKYINITLSISPMSLTEILQMSKSHIFTILDPFN